MVQKRSKEAEEEEEERQEGKGNIRDGERGSSSGWKVVAVWGLEYAMGEEGL